MTRQQETLWVYRLCILALAVEWIFFGSCHFTFREGTEAEIPDWIPWKTAIVLITGIVEVATGVLILLPRTRKWAALTSLILLGLFVPSICKMLIDDTAILGSVTGRNLVRVILVPNHILLALCALHLWRSPDPTIAVSQTPDSILEPQPNPSSQGPTLLVALVMLAANIAGFLVIFASPWSRTTANLWAMMCLATGALLGFLFGVPKVNTEAGKTVTHRPNSNIELVSDWLTKIIVGVGLVEFQNIGKFLEEVSTGLGKALIVQPNDQTEVSAASFAQALIVYFFIAGMIQGYLLTRMYLSRQFEDFEARRSPAVTTTVDETASPGK